MPYDNALQMFVVNNTGGNAIFAFSHQYGGDPPAIWQGGSPTAPGGFAGPLNVGFNSGALTGDYWYCEARVLDGPNPGMFHTDGTLQAPTKECQCQSADDGMVYYFPFSTGGFVIPLISSPCAAGVSQ